MNMSCCGISSRNASRDFSVLLQAVTAVHPPASPGQREVRILYAAQTSVAPPMFVFFTNIATTFHFSYSRFLENRLREAYGFLGTPISDGSVTTIGIPVGLFVIVVGFWVFFSWREPGFLSTFNLFNLGQYGNRCR
mgnify:CR=1 FL=1